MRKKTKNFDRFGSVGRRIDGSGSKRIKKIFFYVSNFVKLSNQSSDSSLDDEELTSILLKENFSLIFTFLAFCSSDSHNPAYSDSDPDRSISLFFSIRPIRIKRFQIRLISDLDRFGSESEYARSDPSRIWIR
jgi:hypothetical protein